MKKFDIRLGFIVVILWGLNFITIKLGLKGIPPLLLATIRLFLVSFPIIFFIPKPPIALRWLIAIAMTLNVGQFSFLFIGMKLGMPAGLASFVLQSQAFITVIIAVILLKERWYWNHLVGTISAAFGMAIIGFSQSNGMTAVGFFLTLAAAFSWAIGNVIIRHASTGIPPYSTLSLIVWVGAIAILPLGILSFFIEGPAAWQSAWHNITWIKIIPVIYLAYLGTLIGYSLWGKLLSRNPAVMVAPFSLLVPIVALIASTLILKESISTWQITGGLMMMVGLLINIFGQKIKTSIIKNPENS